MDFALPFTDFAPSQIPLIFNLRGEEDMALRVRLPPQSNLDPVFSALNKSTHCKNFKTPSKVVVKASSAEMVCDAFGILEVADKAMSIFDIVLFGRI